MEKKIAIVILNYKTYDLTINCIHSILNEGSIVTIFVVDNFSNNNSLEKIKEWCVSKAISHKIVDKNDFNQEFIEQIVLIKNDSNNGYAVGNNLGIKFAVNRDYDYILILNNDVEVQKDSILKLVEFCENNINIGCLGPFIYRNNSIEKNYARRRIKWYEFFFLSGIGSKIFPEKFFLKNHYLHSKNNNNKPFKVDLISGSAMFFPTEILKKINGFDEKTFLYYEEAIICEKLNKLCLSTYVVPTSRMLHNHAKTTSKIKRETILKISLESQFYYLNKYRKYNVFSCFIIMSFHILTYFLILLMSVIIRK